MLIMSKRHYSSSSESSSSDEDNGNFKRKKRNFNKNNINFNENNININEGFDKRLKVLNSKQIDLNLINEQKVLNKRLSALPTYDDIFDSNNTNNSFDNNFDKNSNNNNNINNNRVNDLKSSIDCPLKTTIELVSNDIIDNNSNDLMSEGLQERVIESDPRLRNIQTNRKPLKQRLRESLADRKPQDAYNELKLEVSSLDIINYREWLMQIALDWFPAFIDSKINAKDCFIEDVFIFKFQSVMRDIFSTKTKLTKFWEQLIHGIHDFYKMSKINDLPNLLRKLRVILTHDIRDYLIQEEVKISLKSTNIIVYHKNKLEAIRKTHRQAFENQFNDNKTPITNTKPVYEPIEPIAVQIAREPQVFNSIETFSSKSFRSQPILPKVETISAKPKRDKPVVNPISTKPIRDKPVINPIVGFSTQSVPELLFYETSDTFISQTSHNLSLVDHITDSSSQSSTHSSDAQIYEQIVTLLKAQQYLRLVQMINRHAKSGVYTIIEEFGRAINKFVKTDKFSEVFRKIYDFLHLNPCDDPEKHNIIIKKILDEFAYVVRFNPKEWIAIRDFTKTKIMFENPFDETIITVKHNIINTCDYMNASNNIVIDYKAINAEIPLIAMNVILKDPRVEFKCDLVPNHIEVIDFDDEENIGKFSPFRSDSSMSPTSPTSERSADIIDILPEMSVKEEVITVENTTQPKSVDLKPKLTKRIKLSNLDSNELRKIVRVIDITTREEESEESD